MFSGNISSKIGGQSRELLLLFWSYLKTYVIAAAIFATFFFFYAGIKTDRISIEVIASIIACLVASFVISLAYYYFSRFKPIIEYLVGDIQEVLSENRLKDVPVIQSVYAIIHLGPILLSTIFLYLMIKEYLGSGSGFSILEDLTKQALKRKHATR